MRPYVIPEAQRGLEPDTKLSNCLLSISVDVLLDCYILFVFVSVLKGSTMCSTVSKARGYDIMLIYKEKNKDKLTLQNTH